MRCSCHPHQLQRKKLIPKKICNVFIDTEFGWSFQSTSEYYEIFLHLDGLNRKAFCLTYIFFIESKASNQYKQRTKSLIGLARCYQYFNQIKNTLKSLLLQLNTGQQEFINTVNEFIILHTWLLHVQYYYVKMLILCVRYN